MNERVLFGNEEIKNKFMEPETETTGKKTGTAKFRKTRKMVGYSLNKYQSRSTAKNSTGMKDELVTASIIFNDLKKRNLTFLN